MVKTTNALAILLTFAICRPAAAAELSADQAERALQRTLTPPTISYEGTMTVTHWYGNETRSEDVRVRFSPPAHYRWEFLKPDGSIRRVVVSDGENEVVHFVDNNKSLRGGAVKHAPREMPREKEWALLRENYRIEGADGEAIADRPAWLIRVIPSVDGKMRQDLTIDKQTGVVLENKRYRPHGNFVIRSRFMRFVVMTAAFPADTFVVADATGSLEDHDFATDFFSRDAWAKATGRTTQLPDTLPHGFVLESVDYFIVDGKNVDHFRYTDGLCSISIFQTRHPLRTASVRRISEQGNMVPYSKGNTHYILMGDTSLDLLKDMLRSFP
jgi:outer membrane lipoprotein-sorting protein